MQITVVHGIFLLLPTLDLSVLPSNLLSYLPSVASPSSPTPLSAEQPLLPLALSYICCSAVQCHFFVMKKNNSRNTLKCKTNGRLPSDGERLQQTIVLVSLPRSTCILPWKSFRFDLGKWEMGIQGLKTLAFWDCNPCLCPAAALCIHCCEDLKSCWPLWPNLLENRQYHAIQTVCKKYGWGPNVHQLFNNWQNSVRNSHLTLIRNYI